MVPPSLAGLNKAQGVRGGCALLTSPAREEPERARGPERSEGKERVEEKKRKAAERRRKSRGKVMRVTGSSVKEKLRKKFQTLK